MKSLSLIVILLASFSVHAQQPSLEEQATKKGCQLNPSDQSICTYPSQSITGTEAIAKVGERFHAKPGEAEIFIGDDSCKVVWAPVKDQLGYLAFVDPKNNQPIGQFYFASGLSYTYQKVDYAFDVEQDFYLKHKFRVSGKSAKKYLIIFHEDGDGGYSMSFEVDNTEMSLKEFCDMGF